MSVPAQQFLTNQQRNFDNLIAAQNHIFSGFEQLVNLNIQLFKSSLDEIAAKSQQVAGLQDVQQAAAFVTELAQPSAEKVLNYGKSVFEVVSQVQKEITALTEKQIADNQQQAAEFVEQLAKNAPAGSESAIALVKSGLVAAGNATDTLLKASRQAAELSEANVNAATGAVMKTAEQAAEVVEQNIARARNTK
ncbi:MAG: TIGR01841 family phasin [Alcaligenaceae bacterium]|uniref:TIGR01841 family phasin n=1 Tax=Paenalcaligenes hermetiae TaxID=1157987 RepID=A0ABP9M2A7_9BURK|nr:TIGR01841 family phasin [Paenalcaligenes sp.]NLJ62594.1 TIGR01841 family phasin [Alcaligenaceae bacterium]